VTDYGLPSFLSGQDFQENEADTYKRKNVYTANLLDSVSRNIKLFINHILTKI